MRQIQRGFTLIELMIVVAVIGILAAIAIPMYQDYVTRARWSDNYATVQSLKTAIAECMQTESQSAIPAVAPCDSIANLIGANFLPAGYTAQGRFMTGPADWNGARIQMIGTANAGNCVVDMTTAFQGSHMSWVISSATPSCGRNRIGT